MVSVKLRSSFTDTLQTLIYWMLLHIECSLTLFLSLTLHFIFSCLMKSNNDRISMPRQPVKSLSVKDTKQGPIFIKKKLKSKCQINDATTGMNNGNDNNICKNNFDTTYTYVL